MGAVQFEYIAPSSLEEAVSLLRQNSGGRILAGGMSLVAEIKLRQISPSLLIDLRKIQGLRGISNSRPDNALQIGAMTTCAAIAADQLVWESYPALAEAALRCGDPQIRNFGTLGGNLAYNASAADLPAAAVALGAIINTTGSNGARAILADSFITGPFKTALEPGEIITSIGFPSPMARTGSVYEKFKNMTSGYAICGVAAVVGREPDGTVNRCQVVVTGATDHARRLPRVEAQLAGKASSAENIAAAARQIKEEGLTFLGDLHASAEYRAHLTRMLTEQALARAAERAR